jgi:actin-like ATPase involved in cell morphogenesis
VGQALKHTEPEIAADIIDAGITMTGRLAESGTCLLQRAGTIRTESIGLGQDLIISFA